MSTRPLDSLSPSVQLGYGDVINIASDLDEQGEPVWNISERHPDAAWMLQTARELRAAGVEIKPDTNLYFPTMYVCDSDAPSSPPSTQLTAGTVFWRQDKKGYREPRLHSIDMGATRRPMAVRVLGTLGAATVRQLVIRDIMPQRPSVFMEDYDIPQDDPRYEIACAVIDNTYSGFPPDRQRNPTEYAIPADLSQVEDPTPYLAS